MHVLNTVLRQRERQVQRTDGNEGSGNDTDHDLVLIERCFLHVGRQDGVSGFRRRSSNSTVKASPRLHRIWRLEGTETCRRN